ncbi:MAG: NAD-dependent DNA ligase LigA [Deltaproteobacteria bacterium]|nr:NAD-dependent DNA ligase LigA [Deltaproteobacteria bacterium]
MKGAHLGGGLQIDPASAARIAELAERLAEYRDKYYAGAPAVSDGVYDALEDELRVLAPLHPLLAKIGSPVTSDGWEKARHQIPMGSLNKVTDEPQLGEWLDRCDQILKKSGRPTLRNDLYVAEKLDGISVELIYQDGTFVAGITRGDGEIGERITPNVARMRGVPPRIKHPGQLSVRGEIILRLSDMERHFTDYSSPRNAAAGTARRLDGQGNEHLTVLCYDLAEELDLATEVDKFALLRQLGFATPNSYRGDLDTVLAVYQDYEATKRGELDYEIDGLVLRANQLADQVVLGDVNRRPRGAVAFKFASPSKVSRVLEIRWDVGSSGRVTPVAIVEPVELVGATVRRASLHNMAHVRDLGIGVGDEVLVSRRNDVIPYIEEVVQHEGSPAEPPSQCTVCDAELQVEGEYLMCRNPSCQALVEGRIHNWIDAIGALEWGDKLIAALVETDKVAEPLDLYRLTVRDIASLERHGDKSAQNALDQLQGRLPLQLPVFLAALGIEGFSTQTARLIVSAGFDSIDSVLGATDSELAAISGLGDIKAGQIVAGLQARVAEIARLRAGGLEPVAVEDAGPLAGKTLCITGSHSRPRKELSQLIEGAGGRVQSGVSKDLHYLLIADVESTSSKAVKARRYGTLLISELQLMAMMGTDDETD